MVNDEDLKTHSTRGQLIKYPKYLPEYNEMAYEMALLGKDTQAGLAELFEVNKDTITEWKKNHKKFREAIARGRLAARGKIANALYKRAQGWEQTTTRQVVLKGQIVTLTETTNMPPDTKAALAILSTMEKDVWGDQGQGAGSGVHLQITGTMSAQEAAEVYQKMLSKSTPILDGTIDADGKITQRDE